MIQPFTDEQYECVFDHPEVLRKSTWWQCSHPLPALCCQPASQVQVRISTSISGFGDCHLNLVGTRRNPTPSNTVLWAEKSPCKIPALSPSLEAKEMLGVVKCVKNFRAWADGVLRWHHPIEILVNKMQQKMNCSCPLCPKWVQMNGLTTEILLQHMKYAMSPWKSKIFNDQKKNLRVPW